MTGSGVDDVNGTAAIYTYGLVDINAQKFDVEINAGTESGQAKSYGIRAESGANINVGSADFEVTVTDTVGSAIGIYAHNGAQVKATGSKIVLDVAGADADGWTTGVYARAETSANATSATKVVLGGANTTLVDIDVTNTAGDVQGLWASKYEQSGIESAKPAQIEVNGQSLDLTVEGKTQTIAVWAASKTATGTSVENQSTINLNTIDTVIKATSSEGEAHGIVAHSQGVVNATAGNVYVMADGATLSAAVSGRGNSTINVGKAGYVTQLNGDIVFDYDATGGPDINSEITVLLDGEMSHLKGNVYADNGVEASVVDLTIANNATWYANRNETTNNSNVDKLTLNDGVVDIQGGTTVTVDSELAGSSGTIALGSDSDLFKVVGANNLQSLNVTQAGATADTMSAADAEEVAKTYADNVVDGDGNALDTTFIVAEGEVGGEIVVGANGQATQAVNAKTEALADKVTLAPQMITRILMNDVRKRMGDLRAAEGTHGVWARYNGGQMAGQGVDADFSMVQVGIDTVPVADAPRFGVAFSYAQTEADDAYGTTDMDSFSLAFYGTKFYDNGMFVDVIGRMATMDTDMVNVGNKAKMDNVALSLSGELGWRFDVTDRFFFEPSVEATYTYTNADTFTMGSGKYELEATDSLVGRAGFAAGFKCPANKGDVYVRAAVVHEFMGDMTMNSMTANGRMAAPVVTDGKDTWFEYAIGVQFNVNKNTYVYADVERTEGATMDEDWRANVGVRFAF